MVQVNDQSRGGEILDLDLEAIEVTETPESVVERTHDAVQKTLEDETGRRVDLLVERLKSPAYNTLRQVVYLINIPDCFLTPADKMGQENLKLAWAYYFNDRFPQNIAAFAHYLVDENVEEGVMKAAQSSLATHLHRDEDARVLGLPDPDAPTADLRETFILPPTPELPTSFTEKQVQPGLLENSEEFKSLRHLIAILNLNSDRLTPEDQEALNRLKELWRNPDSLGNDRIPRTISYFGLEKDFNKDILEGTSAIFSDLLSEPGEFQRDFKQLEDIALAPERAAMLYRFEESLRELRDNKKAPMQGGRLDAWMHKIDQLGLSTHPEYQRIVRQDAEERRQLAEEVRLAPQRAREARMATIPGELNSILEQLRANPNNENAIRRLNSLNEELKSLGMISNPQILSIWVNHRKMAGERAAKRIEARMTDMDKNRHRVDTAREAKDSERAEARKSAERELQMANETKERESQIAGEARILFERYKTALATALVTGSDAESKAIRAEIMGKGFNRFDEFSEIERQDREARIKEENALSLLDQFNALHIESSISILDYLRGELQRLELAVLHSDHKDDARFIEANERINNGLFGLYQGLIKLVEEDKIDAELVENIKNLGLILKDRQLTEDPRFLEANASLNEVVIKAYEKLVDDYIRHPSDNLAETFKNIRLLIIERKLVTRRSYKEAKNKIDGFLREEARKKDEARKRKSAEREPIIAQRKAAKEVSEQEAQRRKDEVQALRSKEAIERKKAQRTTQETQQQTAIDEANIASRGQTEKIMTDAEKRMVASRNRTAQILDTIEARKTEIKEPPSIAELKQEGSEATWSSAESKEAARIFREAIQSKFEGEDSRISIPSTLTPETVLMRTRIDALKNEFEEIMESFQLNPEEINLEELRNQMDQINRKAIEFGLRADSNVARMNDRYNSHVIQLQENLVDRRSAVESLEASIEAFLSDTEDTSLRENLENARLKIRELNMTADPRVTAIEKKYEYELANIDSYTESYTEHVNELLDVYEEILEMAKAEGRTDQLTGAIRHLETTFRELDEEENPRLVEIQTREAFRDYEISETQEQYGLATQNRVFDQHRLERALQRVDELSKELTVEKIAASLFEKLHEQLLAAVDDKILMKSLTDIRRVMMEASVRLTEEQSAVIEALPESVSKLYPWNQPAIDLATQMSELLGLDGKLDDYENLLEKRRSGLASEAIADQIQAAELYFIRLGLDRYPRLLEIRAHDKVERESATERIRQIKEGINQIKAVSPLFGNLPNLPVAQDKEATKVWLSSLSKSLETIGRLSSGDDQFLTHIVDDLAEIYGYEKDVLDALKMIDVERERIAEISSTINALNQAKEASPLFRSLPDIEALSNTEELKTWLELVKDILTPAGSLRAIDLAFVRTLTDKIGSNVGSLLTQHINDLRSASDLFKNIPDLASFEDLTNNWENLLDSKKAFDASHGIKRITKTKVNQLVQKINSIADLLELNSEISKEVENHPEFIEEVERETPANFQEKLTELLLIEKEKTLKNKLVSIVKFVRKDKLNASDKREKRNYGTKKSGWTEEMFAHLLQTYQKQMPEALKTPEILKLLEKGTNILQKKKEIEASPEGSDDSFERAKSEIESLRGRPSYDDVIKLIGKMAKGETPLEREEHFPGWSDHDFEFLLEQLGETPSHQAEPNTDHSRAPQANIDDEKQTAYNQVKSAIERLRGDDRETYVDTINILMALAVGDRSVLEGETNIIAEWPQQDVKRLLMNLEGKRFYDKIAELDEMDDREREGRLRLMAKWAIGARKKPDVRKRLYGDAATWPDAAFAFLLELYDQAHPNVTTQEPFIDQQKPKKEKREKGPELALPANFQKKLTQLVHLPDDDRATLLEILNQWAGGEKVWQRERAEWYKPQTEWTNQVFNALLEAYGKESIELAEVEEQNRLEEVRQKLSKYAGWLRHHVLSDEELSEMRGRLNEFVRLSGNNEAVLADTEELRKISQAKADEFDRIITIENEAEFEEVMNGLRVMVRDQSKRFPGWRREDCVALVETIDGYKERESQIEQLKADYEDDLIELSEKDEGHYNRRMQAIELFSRIPFYQLKDPEKRKIFTERFSGWKMTDFKDLYDRVKEHVDGVKKTEALAQAEEATKREVANERAEKIKRAEHQLNLLSEGAQYRVLTRHQLTELGSALEKVYEPLLNKTLERHGLQIEDVASKKRDIFEKLTGTKDENEYREGLERLQNVVNSGQGMEKGWALMDYKSLLKAVTLERGRKAVNYKAALNTLTNQKTKANKLYDYFNELANSFIKGGYESLNDLQKGTYERQYNEWTTENFATLLEDINRPEIEKTITDRVAEAAEKKQNDLAAYIRDLSHVRAFVQFNRPYEQLKGSQKGVYEKYYNGLQEEHFRRILAELKEPVKSPEIIWDTEIIDRARAALNEIHVEMQGKIIDPKELRAFERRMEEQLVVSNRSPELDQLTKEMLRVAREKKERFSQLTADHKDERHQTRVLELKYLMNDERGKIADDRKDLYDGWTALDAQTLFKALPAQDRDLVSDEAVVESTTDPESEPVSTPHFAEVEDLAQMSAELHDYALRLRTVVLNDEGLNKVISHLKVARSRTRELPGNRRSVLLETERLREVIEAKKEALEWLLDNQADKAFRGRLRNLQHYAEGQKDKIKSHVLDKYFAGWEVEDAQAVLEAYDRLAVQEPEETSDADPEPSTPEPDETPVAPTATPEETTEFELKDTVPELVIPDGATPNQIILILQKYRTDHLERDIFSEIGVKRVLKNVISAIAISGDDPEVSRLATMLRDIVSEKSLFLRNAINEVPAKRNDGIRILESIINGNRELSYYNWSPADAQAVKSAIEKSIAPKAEPKSPASKTKPELPGADELFSARPELPGVLKNLIVEVANGDLLILSRAVKLWDLTQNKVGVTFGDSHLDGKIRRNMNPVLRTIREIQDGKVTLDQKITFLRKQINDQLRHIAHHEVRSIFATRPDMPGSLQEMLSRYVNKNDVVLLGRCIQLWDIYKGRESFGDSTIDQKVVRMMSQAEAFSRDPETFQLAVDKLKELLTLTKDKTLAKKPTETIDSLFEARKDDIPDGLAWVMSKVASANLDTAKRLIELWDLYKGKGSFADEALHEKAKKWMRQAEALSAVDGTEGMAKEKLENLLAETRNVTILPVPKPTPSEPTTPAERRQANVDMSPEARERERLEALLLDMTSAYEDLNTTIELIFAVLETDARRTHDSYNFARIQDDFKNNLLFKEIPEALGLDPCSSYADLIKKLEALGVRGARKKAVELNTLIMGDDELHRILAELFPPHPDDEDDDGTGSDDGPSGGGTIPTAPGRTRAPSSGDSSGGPDGPAPTPPTRPTVGPAAPMATPSATAARMALDARVDAAATAPKGKEKIGMADFLGQLGIKPHEDHPASIAIQRLLVSHPEADFKILLNFLREPTGLGSEELASLKLQKNDVDTKLLVINAQVTAANRMLSLSTSSAAQRVEATAIITNLTKDQTELRNKSEILGEEIQLRSSKRVLETRRYNSREEVLFMLNYYFAALEARSRGERTPNLTDVLDRGHQMLQEAEKIRVNSGHGVLSKLVGFVKPSLEGTLLKIGQEDGRFKGITPEQLKNLNKQANTYKGVENWIDELNLGAERSMKVVSTLVGHLKIMINAGHISRINTTSLSKAVTLASHLRQWTHEACKEQALKNTGSQLDKMSVYFAHLNSANGAQAKVGEELVLGHSRKGLGKSMLKLGTVGGGVAAGVMLGPLLTAAGAGGVMAALFAKMAVRQETPENKLRYRNMAIRTGVTTVLGAGSAALFGLPALTALGIGAAGILTPEAWNAWQKHKVALKEGVLKPGASMTASAAGWGLKKATAATLILGTGFFALLNPTIKNMMFG